MKLASLPETKSTIRFKAELVPAKPGEAAGSCSLLTLPRKASATLHARGTTMVEGTINGFPFRVALESNGKGSHTLRVNKAMHGGAGAEAGDVVTAEITRVGDEVEIRLPAELRKALVAVPLARDFWAKTTPLARRDWVLWICSGKQPATRQIRIEKACDMLACGKKRVCCFGGINWLLKDHGTSGGVWR